MNRAHTESLESLAAAVGIELGRLYTRRLFIYTISGIYPARVHSASERLSLLTEAAAPSSFARYVCVMQSADIHRLLQYRCVWRRGVCATMRSGAVCYVSANRVRLGLNFAEFQSDSSPSWL